MRLCRAYSDGVCYSIRLKHFSSTVKITQNEEHNLLYVTVGQIKVVVVKQIFKFTAKLAVCIVK